MSNDDIVDALNKLIETCKDGEHGFRLCAEHLNDAGMRQAFAHRATECAQAAAELQALVARFGGSPEDSGTAEGALHRGWVAVKGSLTGYSDVAILEETERGEDEAMAAYREALAQPLPADVREVVERHFEGVKRNHAHVRTLREQARTAA